MNLNLLHLSNRFVPSQNHLLHFSLRRGSLVLPHTPPKKDMEHPSQFASTLRKDTLGASTGSLRKESRTWGSKRDLVGGSMNALNNKNYLQVPGHQIRRNSRNYSTDSLDGRRNSWDPGRRGSSGSSCGWDEPIYEDTNKKVRISCFLVKG